MGDLPYSRRIKLSVFFHTPNPQKLLNLFNERIEQDEPKGRINTWERSQDKVYYTHKSDQWGRDAWFKPTIEKEGLRFNIIKPKSSNVSSEAYAYYHGHLTQTFLDHFDQQFNHAVSSALPTPGDIVS